MPRIPDDRQQYTDREYLRYKKPDLCRAMMQDLGDMVELYSAARAADDPQYADEYPSPDEIREDIEKGQLWYGVEDGEIIMACAITPEPVFAYDWELAMRMPKLPRLPGENWFRPGERYLSVLRFAVCDPARRRGLTGMMCWLAAQLAYECGIYEVRTRIDVRQPYTGREVSRAGYTIVGVGQSPDGRQYFGYYTRTAPMYARPEESRRYRPEEDDHDLDAYHEYDFDSDIAEMDRLNALMRKYDSAPSDDTEDEEDLMEDI